eukprot:scaffold4358_cov177-Ochromonas_danica.AAC.5
MASYDLHEVEGEDGWKNLADKSSNNFVSSRDDEMERMSEISTSTNSQSVKVGWYVGKYLGLRKHIGEELAAKAREEQTVRQSVDQGSLPRPSISEASTSKWFSYNTATKSSTHDSGDTATTTAVDRQSSVATSTNESSSSSDESKSERVFVRTIRSIRNKCLSRKLDGMINIRRVSGVVTAAMQCKFTSSDKLTDSHDDGDGDGDNISDLPSQFQRAITGTDLILDSLERRSKGWEGVDFAHDVTLTRGLSVGLSDPILGLIGWSISVEITATVPSLLASRKRYEQMKASTATTTRSSFRFPSFQLSGGSKDIHHLPATHEVNDEVLAAMASHPPGGDSDLSEEESEGGGGGRTSSA